MALGKGRPDGNPAPGPNKGDPKASNSAQKPGSGRQRAVSQSSTKPQAKGPGQARQRSTQMISLEPPKRRTGPRLAPNSRLDNIAARQRSGSTGVQKPAEAPPGVSVRRRPDAAEEKALPFQASPSPDAAPMLGGGESDASDYMFRRKGTRRIPKPGGGVMGDRPALDKLNQSDRLPAVPPPDAPVPPLPSVPPPKAPQFKHNAPPPPPNARPNSLAGVRAEDLLGEEYRPMLEQMYKRQQQISADRARTGSDEVRRPASGPHPMPTRRPPTGESRVPTGQYPQPGITRRPTAPIPPIPVQSAPSEIEPLPPLTAPPRPQPQRQVRTPSGGWTVPPPPRHEAPSELAPKASDSSRQHFIAADRDNAARRPEQDVLAPQGDFLAGPGKPPQANVVQTPLPARPPADDLGYDRPVDFGDLDSADTVITTGHNPMMPSSVSPPAGLAAGAAQEVVEEESLAGLDLREVTEEAARESAAHEEMEQRTGYLLWLQGVITVEEVEDSLTAPGEAPVPPEIMNLLNESGFADQQALYRFLARHETLAPVDLDVVTPNEKALAVLRPAVARAYRVIPLAVMGKILLIAVSMPFDPKHLLEIRSLTGRKVKLFAASAEAIDEALKKYYPGGPRGASGPQPAVASDAPQAGDKLEKSYDPTVSGEDSGLYAPQPGPGEGAGSQNADSGVQLEEAEGGSPTITSRGIETSDLDESTLGEPSEESSEADDSSRAQDSTGSEEEDPYAEIADAAAAGGDEEMMRAAGQGGEELHLDDDDSARKKKVPPPQEGASEDDPFGG